MKIGLVISQPKYNMKLHQTQETRVTQTSATYDGPHTGVRFLTPNRCIKSLKIPTVHNEHAQDFGRTVTQRKIQNVYKCNVCRIMQPPSAPLDSFFISDKDRGHFLKLHFYFNEIIQRCSHLSHINV